MKLSYLICLGAALGVATASAEGESELKKQVLGKLLEAEMTSKMVEGCNHDHGDDLTDALYRAIARDLGDIQGVEISRNDKQVRAVGEIVSAEDWALYRRVVARYNSQISDYVVFRPGVKLMNDFKGQLTSAGYEIVEVASPDKPGKIAFSYSAGILTLTGWFLSQDDLETARGIVASQTWLTSEGEAKDGSVPCILRFKVIDRLIDVGVVFVEIDAETAEKYGNRLADGKILDFELVASVARALGNFVPESGGDHSEGGSMGVSSDTRGMIEAVASDGMLVARMSGHATINTNTGDQRAKFRNGGKVLLKVPGQLAGGDIKEVEYGFMIDCKCNFVRSDVLSLDIKLEQSDMPQRNQDSDDYAQRKIEFNSRIVCRVGETVVLAGSHELSDDVKGPSGFAFLRKIPILGWIFASGDESKEDKRLLVLVSPTYLENELQLSSKPSAENSELETQASEHLKEEVDGKLGVSRWYHVFYFWKWF